MVFRSVKPRLGRMVFNLIQTVFLIHTNQSYVSHIKSANHNISNS